MQRLATMMVVAGLAGCVPRTSIQYVATNTPPSPMVARPAATVEIFASSLPRYEFVEVGILHGRKNWGDRDALPQVIEALREAAAERGCDAVLVNGPNNTTTSTTSSLTKTTSVEDLEGYWGSCIMYTSTEIVASPARFAPR
jgi:hypothetical protein